MGWRRQNVCNFYKLCLEGAEGVCGKASVSMRTSERGKGAHITFQMCKISGFTIYRLGEK